ncbi:MAG: Gx transporter family protein [Candidatus Cloacimonetes bacterium]|jgi:heptaprenyl diphosphate synthase|nr:Gx transporter family protein [Candidatus Cloacimonadota bacterium]NLO44333.1 Gx transporter family protein [Candidatus Cloacimonadota bacterium]
MQKKWLFFAYLTATASIVHVVESWIFRAVPIPFLRLGLSNIVLLYLVWQKEILAAFAVCILKAIIGGLATFTLLSPTILLSVGGGIAAVSAMSLGLLMRPRFSAIGISILGAVAHNIAQLWIAKYALIRSDSVFVLTPILILFGLISGMLTSGIYLYLMGKIPGLKAIK